jgi:hypothetical protein
MLHVPQHPIAPTLKSTKYEDLQLAVVPYLTSLLVSDPNILLNKAFVTLLYVSSLCDTWTVS